MIQWVELNKDGIFASLMVAIVMLPIAELFTSFMNKRRNNKKYNNNKSNKHSNEYMNSKKNVNKTQVVEIYKI